MNSSKRAQSDLRRLSRKFNVEVPDDSKCNEFTVDFIGPNDTPYSGGLWKINVRLPEQYPFKSPSIGFKNKIFHPNVDEGSGSICMDVINQTWTPMFDLINVFEVFLPQLLAYPNPASPLNGEAATLLMADEGKYERRVKEHVRQYAPGSKRTKTLATSSSHSPSSSNNGQGKKRNSDISRPIVGVPAHTRTSTSHSVQSQPQNLSTVATTTTGLEPSSFAYSLDSSTGYTTHTSLSASSANSISDSNSNGNSNNCFSPADTITNTSNNIFMSISTHSNKYSHSNSSGIRMTNNSPSIVGMDSNTNMFASVGSADHDMNGDAQAVHVSHSPKLDRECANKTPLTETAYRSLSTSDGVGTTTAIAVGMEVDPDGMDMNMSARRIFESADDLEFWASISDVSDMSDEEY